VAVLVHSGQIHANVDRVVFRGDCQIGFRGTIVNDATVCLPISNTHLSIHYTGTLSSMRRRRLSPSPSHHRHVYELASLARVHRARKLAKYGIFGPPKPTVPRGWANGSGGVLVALVLAGKAFREEISHLRQKHALWLNPRYDADSEY
jgi:hypothetical protein